MNTVTVSLNNPKFELEGVEFTVVASRYSNVDFTVEIDGGYGLADYEDGSEGYVEIDGNFEVTSFETTEEISDDDTEFEVTITAEELARAKEYRANYPVDID